jgi:hypothetical protein
MRVVRFRELLTVYRRVYFLWACTLPQVRRMFGKHTLPFSCKVAGGVCLCRNARREISDTMGERIFCSVRRELHCYNVKFIYSTAEGSTIALKQHIA